MKEVPLYGDDQMMISHKMKECEIMNQMIHPNINNFKEYFFHKDNMYIVNDYCDRGYLETYIEKFSNLNIKRIKKIALEILLVIEHLHFNKIIHKDMRP